MAGKGQSRCWAATAAACGMLLLAGSTPAPAQTFFAFGPAVGDMLNDYPLVVVAAWDDGDFADRTRDGNVTCLSSIRLRVSRVLKGACGKTLDVKFSGRLSLRYGCDSEKHFFMGWQPDPDRPAANTWAMCSQSRPFNPGGTVDVAVVKDVRREAVYFLGREDKESTLWFEYEYLLRGEKWSPMSLPRRGRPAETRQATSQTAHAKASATGPATSPASDSATRPAAASMPAVFEINDKENVQPAHLADGWASLLAGREPDVFFRALQPFDSCTRDSALEEIRRKKDPRLWDRIVESALAGECWDLFYGARDPLLDEPLLARVKAGRPHGNRLWDSLLGVSTAAALQAAPSLLADGNMPREWKEELLRGLLRQADRRDGGAEAALLARYVEGNDETLRTTAFVGLVCMAVDRGGTLPLDRDVAALGLREWNNVAYARPRLVPLPTVSCYPDPRCCPGALDKVTAAMKKELGEEGFQRLLTRFPPIRTALQERMVCNPRQAEWDGRSTAEMRAFLDGNFPLGTLTIPWDALCSDLSQDFNLKTMARAMVTPSIEKYHRQRCWVGLMQAAILFPRRVNEALDKTPGMEDDTDVVAIRCFIDPNDRRAAEDVKVELAGLYYDNQQRAWWHARAVAASGTPWAKEMLEIILARSPDENVKALTRQTLEECFGPSGPGIASSRPAVTAAIGQIMKDVSAADKGPAAIEGRDGLLDVLRTSDDPRAAAALYEFLLRRPYARDIHRGRNEPSRFVRPCMEALLRKNSRSWFRLLKSYREDPDRQWAYLAGEALQAALGRLDTGKDADSLIEAMSNEKDLSGTDLDLRVLECRGVRIGDIRSKGAAKAVSRALFRPAGVPLAKWSHGESDQAIAHLLTRVAKREWGPMAAWAAEACSHVPEDLRAEAMEGVLNRLRR